VEVSTGGYTWNLDDSNCKPPLGLDTGAAMYLVAIVNRRPGIIWETGEARIYRRGRAACYSASRRAWGLATLQTCRNRFGVSRCSLATGCRVRSDPAYTGTIVSAWSICIVGLAS